MHAMGKNLQIRNVPDRTHRVLRRRAADAGMSLQEYLLSLVNEAASKPTVEEVLSRVTRRSSGKFRLRDAVDDLKSERASH
jgi:antitoxin FitA